MSAIGPGDWVECIDGSVGKCTGATGLVQGAVYQVTVTWPSGCIRLAEVSHPLSPAWEWGGHRFRPIYTPKSEIIQRLLQPVRVDA